MLAFGIRPLETPGSYGATPAISCSRHIFAIDITVIDISFDLQFENLPVRAARAIQGLIIEQSLLT
jgi:hypothetical protein